ncbi:hypothetical protein C3408_13945 [Candidatus Pantoea alvi]|nr:hypothetical protein C3408_13945 [Pantoea alvi]
MAMKKRPNTIPVFGPGKWLFESRALKVGINAGDDALQLKVSPRLGKCQRTAGQRRSAGSDCDPDGRISKIRRGNGSRLDRIIYRTAPGYAR